jgi:hypothetical protein
MQSEIGRLPMLGHPIREAMIAVWGSRPVPHGVELVPATWGEYGECAEGFEGLGWEEIPFEVLRFHRSCLSFFAEAALCYYLPAFMLASLEERRTDATAWDVTEYTLAGINRLVGGSTVVLAVDEVRSIRDFLALLKNASLSEEAASDVNECLRGVVSLLAR